jgi:ELWxxDGT repeat protein
MVKDIWPGPQPWPHTNWLTDVNDTLFFTANDSSGEGLWKSSGSEQTTVIVSQSPDVWGHEHLRNTMGTLFFVAEHATYGRELWKSDGTDAGTVMVKDIYAGSPADGAFDTAQRPDTITAVGGTLFFQDGGYTHTLWKSDGTEDGTVRVKDCLMPHHLSDINGTLFFTAADPCAAANRLWKSDGTEEGTVMVSSIGTSPGPVTDVNGTLFFADFTVPNGSELWQTDGTPEGTVMVKDLDPGPAGSNPGDLTNLNSRLLFSANDGIYGNELWIYVDWFCSEAITGDLNNDCQVDFKDFCHLASSWLDCNRRPDYLCGL